MPSQMLRLVNVFISTPGDVYDERNTVREVIEQLNRSSEINREYVLKPIGYEDFVPPMVGITPQETVDRYMMSVDQSDIYIGILWSRLGTPISDAATGQQYESGTVYEFQQAYEAFQKSGTPKILLYRSNKPLSLNVDFEQVARVKTFFKRFEGTDATFNLSYKTYETVEEFAKILQNDLQQMLHSLTTVIEEKPAIPETAADELKPQPTPRGIFISYRRDDSAMASGRVYDRLAIDFGRPQLFMDIDAIEPGDDFVTAIETAVSQCKVLLAIIGPKWLTIAESSGRRRIDNPNDFVRVEITTALKRNIRVIPVIVESAPIPRADELPEVLQTLARRNAIEINTRYFHRDMDKLVETLVKVL